MDKIELALQNQIREYYKLKKEEEEAAKNAKILGAGIHELFRKSGKKNVEVDNIIVEFIDETEGSSPKYKEAFTQALTKVNLATLKVLQQILLENTKVTKVSAQLRRSKVNAGAVLTEGVFDSVKGKVLDWYNKILAKYKSLFAQKEKAQDAFIIYYSNLSDTMSKEYKMKHHIAESKKPQIKLSRLIEAVEKQTGKKLVLKEQVRGADESWGDEDDQSVHTFTNSEISALNKGLKNLKIKSGFVQSEDSVNLTRVSKGLEILSREESNNLQEDAKKLVKNIQKLIPDDWGYVTDDYFVFDSWTEIRIAIV